jgi:hypothetical protein
MEKTMSNIKSLETENAELRVSNQELRYQLKIRDAMACKTCHGAGTVMIAIDDGMDCPDCVEKIADIKSNAVSSILKTNLGVYVENSVMASESGQELMYFADDIRNYAIEIRNKDLI